MGAEGHDSASGAIAPTPGPAPAVLVAEPVPVNPSAPFYPPASPAEGSAVQGVVVAPASYGSYQTAGAAPSGLTVNHPDVKLYDTWAVPFFDCKGWRKILVSACCMPCTSIEVEAITERWANPEQPSTAAADQYAMRLLPVLVMDFIPCLFVGVPIPMGSALTNIRNRRAFRAHNNIQRGFCADVFSSLCLPCSVNQLAEQAARRGEEEVGTIISTPSLHASRAMI